MNDFDDIIGGAVGARADSAPGTRPDFGDVLASRQQRMRRRSVVGAVGVLAIGVTGMAAFAVGGPTESTADGPDTPIGSDGPYAPTTMPGFSVEATVPGEMVWYCEGRLGDYAAFPTTTIAPPTTIAVQVDTGPDDSSPFPDATYVLTSEDSGYFQSCVLVAGDPPAVARPVDEDVTMTTSVEQFPTTTTTTIEPSNSGPDSDPVPTTEYGSQSYVVQAGDYAVLVADQFCVPLEDLINFNGWDTGNEFPFPGEVIKVPPGGCVLSPSVPCTTPGCNAAAIHTVQAGDYLIKIANEYCVAVDDVVALNGWQSGAEDFPFPGEQVLIPTPLTDGVCPDNGDS